MLEGLKEKAGPLPVWGWGVAGAVGVAVVLWYGSRPGGPATAAQGQPGATVVPGPSNDLIDAQLHDLRNELDQILGAIGNSQGTDPSASPTPGGATSNMTDIASAISWDFASMIGLANRGVNDFYDQYTASQRDPKTQAPDLFGMITWANAQQHMIEERLNAHYQYMSPGLSTADAARLRGMTASMVEQSRLWRDNIIQGWQTSMPFPSIGLPVIHPPTTASATA